MNHIISKSKLYTHICFLGLMFFLVVLPFSSSAKLIDKVVAVVNGDIITLTELEQEASSLYLTATKDIAGEKKLQVLEEIREATLDRMIDKRIIEQRAKELRVGVSDKEIDNAYKKTRDRLSLSQSEFRKKLESSGLSEETYRNDLGAKILQSKVLSLDVRSKIVVTDEMIRKYYDEKFVLEIADGGYYLLQIGFIWDKNSETFKQQRTARLKTAQRIRDLALQGQDFKILARKFSELPSARDGGDIGVFTLDDMAPQMRKVIEPLAPGEISEISEISNTYQFFKLVTGQDDKAVASESFEQVKDEIREKLFEEKLQDAFQGWVNDLKAKAYIQKL